MNPPETKSSAPSPVSSTPRPPIHEVGASPTIVQAWPSHRASPGMPTKPDANNSLWKVMTESTSPAGGPSPIGCQAIPSHRAAPPIWAPPADVKAPPAISAAPVGDDAPAACRALILPFIPGCPGETSQTGPGSAPTGPHGTIAAEQAAARSRLVARPGGRRRFSVDMADSSIAALQHSMSPPAADLAKSPGRPFTRSLALPGSCESPFPRFGRARSPARRNPPESRSSLHRRERSSARQPPRHAEPR